MTRVTFSRHARDRIKRRRIPSRQITLTINSPDKLSFQPDGTKRAASRFERNGKEYVLLVVYRELGETKRVVTAFHSSKVKKYLG